MATTKASYWSQIADLVEIIDEGFKFANTNTKNYVALETALLASLEGKHLDQTVGFLQNLRSALNQYCGSSASNLLDSVIQNLARDFYESGAASTIQALADINKGLYDDSETIASRVNVYGTPSFVGTGNGTIYRNFKDVNNVALERNFEGDVDIVCTQDLSLGANEGNEVFQYFGRGATPPIDVIELGNYPAEIGTITAINARTSLVEGAGFEESSGTGATLEFENWTLDDATKFLENSTILQSATSTQSLEFVDNGTVEQAVVAQNADIPYMLVVPFYRKNSCDGTLTVTLGSQTVVKTLSAETNGAWSYATIGVGDNKGYYEKWKKNDPKISVALASRTTGELVIDDILLVSPTYINGGYYAILSGLTNFLREDTFTCIDTSSNTGRIQRTIQRLYGYSLNHSGTPTYADAT